MDEKRFPIRHNTNFISLAVLALIALFFIIQDSVLDETGDVAFLIREGSFWLVLIAMLFLVYHKFPGRLAGISLKREGGLQRYLEGVLYGIVLFIAFISLASVFSIVDLSSFNRDTNFLLHFLFMFAFIGEAAFEEALCRGVVLHTIGKGWAVYWGILLNALFFSLLHIPGGPLSVLSILNIIIVGIFYSLAVIGSDSLLTSCGMHFSWNFIQTNVFSSPNAGYQMENGMFQLINLSQSEVLTGGQYGPDASIITTFLLLLGILWLLGRYRKRFKEIFGNRVYGFLHSKKDDY